MRRGLHTSRKAKPPLLAAGTAADDEGALTVGALTRRIKDLLEDGIGRVSVAGEIGSFKAAPSGHVYFSLKDEQAVLDAVIWRSTAGRLRFKPQVGDQVLARGELAVYEPRGRYQLIVSSLRPAGRGELRQRFEALVEKLRAEGLFAPAHKRPLPPCPACVGLVTSPTGAAVRDMIKVMRRRWPGVRIVVSPCLVQGSAAAQDIAAAIERLERWGGCEVMIVGRGGGSMEDLWPFNEESVARAVFAARTPVVSAVGHETDFTITDFVADLRAATPSEAAETVVPDVRERRRRARELRRRLDHGLVTVLHEARDRMRELRRALPRPLTGRLREARTRLRVLVRTPVLRRPRLLIENRRQRLDEVGSDLGRAMLAALQAGGRRAAVLAARLEGLSPLGALARGYSVLLDPDTRRVVRSVGQAQPGKELRARLADGTLRLRVQEVEPGQA